MRCGANWCAGRPPMRQSAIEPAAESMDSSRCIRGLRADCCDPFGLRARLHLAGDHPPRDCRQHVLRLPQLPAMSLLRRRPRGWSDGIRTAVSQVRAADLGTPVTPPRRHWRSYGNDPLPAAAEAMDEPLSAFPSWFLRIECDRCGKVQMVNEAHAGGGTAVCATSSPGCATTAAAGGQGRRSCSPASRALPACQCARSC
jgi:hypothetical protein